MIYMPHMLQNTDSQAQRGSQEQIEFYRIWLWGEMIYSTEDFKVTKLSLLQRKKTPPKERMNYLKILSDFSTALWLYDIYPQYLLKE